MGVVQLTLADQESTSSLSEARRRGELRTRSPETAVRSSGVFESIPPVLSQSQGYSEPLSQVKSPRKARPYMV
jgi:hypothetical protein